MKYCQLTMIKRLHIEKKINILEIMQYWLKYTLYTCL